MKEVPRIKIHRHSIPAVRAGSAAAEADIKARLLIRDNGMESNIVLDMKRNLSTSA